MNQCTHQGSTGKMSTVTNFACMIAKYCDMPEQVWHKYRVKFQPGKWFQLIPYGLSWSELRKGGPGMLWPWYRKNTKKWANYPSVQQSSYSIFYSSCVKTTLTRFDMMMTWHTTPLSALVQVVMQAIAWNDADFMPMKLKRTYLNEAFNE